MASKMFFDGRSYSTPTTASRVDDTAMAPKALTVGNVMALIGRATGSKPNTVVRHGGPTEARKVLKSGELCDAAVDAFAPSAQTNAPSEVVTIRVGRATQAQLVLNDSASAPAVILMSADWGPEGNQIKARIEAGTVRGKRVTVALRDVAYQQDNVARELMAVRYAGAGATAVITTAPESVLLTVAGATAANILLADFPTLQDLADRIASVPGFSAVLVAGAAQQPSGTIDRITSVDVKTADVMLTGHLQAVIDWLNSPAAPIVSATRAANASLPPANIGFTYLAGGTEPAVNNADWQAAFDVLQLADVQWFVPVSGDAAVHAMADAHAIFMSSAARKERRGFVGGPAGLTVDAVPARAKAIASDRTAFVWPARAGFDATGKLVIRPGYMTAVLVAAGFAGLPPGETMSNKTIRVPGLEFPVRNPVDTDVLIQAGVCCVEETDEGFKVVRAVSTHLANDNFNRVEISTGAATDYVARNVRQAVDPCRGQGADPRNLARAVSLADSALRELERAGIIVGDENSPAFRNIRAFMQGDIIAVEFECSPKIPTNFISVSIALVPYSGTATA